MSKVKQISDSIPEQSKNGLLEDLKKIGFTQNEAKTFLALISLESSSASNLVRKTGIRDSKIYHILDQLEKKGFITVQEGTPKRYMVVHPSTPLQNVRLKFKRQYKEQVAIVERLETLLQPMYHESEDSPKLAYIIKGKNNVLNHIKRLMDEAVSSVVLMMPRPEIVTLLEKSIKKLKIKNIDLQLGLYHKIASETELAMEVQLITCECFFLIIDNKVLLTVSRWNTDFWYAIWTTEISLIEVSSGYFSSPCCAFESSNC